ncbi:RIIA lysis inhibitor [Vibrio phage D479]
MIIKQPNQTVKTSGKMRTSGFNMKASAKGFRIISTTLYSDPILAIVRELICNAWDAHVDAMNFEQDIEIHLPNELEPWFAVKDFGIGMSDDTIFGVYTTVFDSTKDQSNDVIGAMGLGSKTPFSYNDGQSFTVTSVHNGLKAVYSAYLEKGEPAITCMVEPHETDEPNGVEVKVPVVTSDFSKFRYAADNVAPFFSAPAVTSNVQLSDREFVQLDGYFMEPRGSGVYAMMGNVCYPIQSNKINGYSQLTAVTNRAIYLNFDIGELDIQASRESLHYDDETIHVIETRIADLRETMIKDAQEWLDDQEFPSIREAYCGVSKNYTQTVRTQLDYNGINLRDWAVEQSNGDNITISGSFVKYKHQHGDMKRLTRFRQLHDVFTVEKDYRNNPMVIIQDDLKTGGVAITRNWAAKNGQCWYYHRDKHTTLGPMSLIRRMEDHEYKILKTSELTEYKPTPVSRGTYGGNRTPTVKVWRLTQDDYSSTNIDLEQLKTGNIHYVSLFYDFIESTDFSECRFAGEGEARSSLRWIMKQKGIDEVFVVRRQYLKRVQKNPNSKNLLTYKFTEKQLEKKFNWTGIAMDTDLDKYQTRQLRLAWKKPSIQKRFKVSSSAAGERKLVEKLSSAFPVLKDIKSRRSTEAIDKLLEIQRDPKNELLFGLVDSATPDSMVAKLIKVMGKS